MLPRRSAVIKCHRIPAGTAEGLCQVEIFFVAGEAVADDYCGVRSWSGRLINEAVDEQAVGGDVDHGHLRGMRGVGWRIGVDGRGNGLGRNYESSDE